MDYLKSVKVREKIQKVDAIANEESIVFRIVEEEQMLQLKPALNLGMQSREDFIFYMRLANAAPLMAKNMIRISQLMDAIKQNVPDSHRSADGVQLFDMVQKLCDSALDCVAHGPEEALKKIKQDC